MSQKGHHLTIFSSAFSHYHFRYIREIDFPRLWRRETIDGVTFVWIKTLPSYHRNDARRIINMLSFAVLAVIAGISSAQRPDLVSGVTVHPAAALSGWAL